MSDLNTMLDDISVVAKFQCDQDVVRWWPDDLQYGVLDNDGFVALFRCEAAAYQYRLALINQRLNVGWEVTE
jgi:hypothetical protein